MCYYLFLSCRVQSYIKNGWAGNIINPDAYSTLSSSVPINDNKEAAFTGQWKSIQTAFQQSDQVPTFTYGHMITYFVNRSVADGLPAADFKSINSAANNLFEGGHIQNLEVGESEECLFVRSNCLPEMRKD